MSVITFMSDFGTTDHYVAAVKASIVSQKSDQVIVDLSHDIRPFDIGHASTLLKQVYKEFPVKTVHLVAVESMKEKSKPIAIELDGHFFVGFDSGLFSLISDKKPKSIARLEMSDSVFPAKEVLAKAATQLASGRSVVDVGEEITTYHELYPRQIKVTKREIAGNVVSVDHYGNLITNIQKEDFEKILSINGNGTSHLIRFGREAFNKVHTYYTEVDSGDCFVMFNSLGYLQIGINKGNASELLGLRMDAPVIVEFNH